MCISQVVQTTWTLLTTRTHEYTYMQNIIAIKVKYATILCHMNVWREENLENVTACLVF